MANRRDFLKIAGTGMAAVAIPEWANASAVTKGKKASPEYRLGVASYTLRKFSTEQALDMTVRCGVNRITFKDMHLPLNASDETIRKTVELCKKKGVELYGAGVIYMRTKEEVDQAFRYASTAQMEMIVGVPVHELLDYVEEKVKQHDIQLAIHNHGPGDKLYPSAESAYKLIKNRDKRMGLCIDIGHTKRINGNPEQDVKNFFDRVLDIHIKDVTEATAKGTTSIIGRGVIDFPSFLKTVMKLKYKGTLALEYEAEEDDPLPGMMECFGYTKGVLAMI
jgi:inosose dehydratase